MFINKHTNTNRQHTEIRKYKKIHDYEERDFR